MKKYCYKFASLITGLIDQELDVNDEKAVRKHLSECPDCHGRYLSEMNLKQLVKERFPVFRAPSYLHKRIRRQLLRKGEVPSFGQLLQSLFVYRPAAASFSLAVIMFLMFFPMYALVTQHGLLGTSSTRMTEEQAKSAVLNGKIICIDCEFLARNQKKHVHDPAKHRSGLKTADGKIWGF
ncbi:MAG: anti-sigma factor family protein, partial [bacterium]